MGCSKSKVDIEEPAQVAPPNPPETDSRLPLNARQIFRLQKSWKGIKRRMEETGVELFIGLFKRNHELKNLFKQFRNLETSDDMRENDALAMHGVMVLSAIDDMIMGLDDVDAVLKQCNDIRESHKLFEGFNSSLFWNLEEPFLAAVKVTLEDACSEQMTQIYSIAVHFIIETITGESFSKDANGIAALDNG